MSKIIFNKKKEVQKVKKFKTFAEGEIRHYAESLGCDFGEGGFSLSMNGREGKLIDGNGDVLRLVYDGTSGFVMPKGRGDADG